MDLRKFDFSDHGICMDVDERLLSEARKRGMDDSDHPYCRLFSRIFFSNAPIHFKEDVDGDFLSKVKPYLMDLSGSFFPKHEHKEAVCALLLSEIAEL